MAGVPLWGVWAVVDLVDDVDGLLVVPHAATATAQSSGMLIAFRVLQGMGGGFVLPIAMAYVYRLSPPEKIGVVMGMMGVPILFAPAIGPVVSGWLVQYADWRWIFSLNLPIGVIGVLIGLRSLPVVARQAVGQLDYAGMVLAPLAFASLSYGVSEGASSWTSTNTIGGIAVGLVALIGFIIAELRATNPLLELRVFRSVDFSLAILTQWISQFALFGALFLVPLFLQQVRGYGAFNTGLTLLPQALAAGIVMPIGGMLFDRIGARPLVLVGTAIMAVAAYVLSTASITTTSQDLIVPLALYGAGMGLMMMPLNTHLINAAPRKLVSRVTSLTNALQQVVNSLTIAGLATILTSRSTTHINDAKAAILAKYPQLATMPAHPTAASLAHLPKSAALLMAQVTHQITAAVPAAMAHGFDDTYRVMIVGAIIGAVMGLTLRRNLAAQSSHAESEQEAGSSELAHAGMFSA
jgi:EmrB/QacA subfamily drug resistance transporter